jgi:hypothetical protein
MLRKERGKVLLVLEWLPRGAVSPEFPRASLHSGREAAMSNATWKDLYDAAIVEFDLKKLPERVEAARQAIHQYQIQRGHALAAEERDEIDDALRTLFTLMPRRAA